MTTAQVPGAPGLWHRSGSPEGDRSRGSSVEGAHSDREFGHLTNEPAAPGMGPDYRAKRGSRVASVDARGWHEAGLLDRAPRHPRGAGCWITPEAAMTWRLLRLERHDARPMHT